MAQIKERPLMKRQLRKFNLLVSLKIIDITDFYSVGFMETDMSFQGTFSECKLQKYIKLFKNFELRESDSSWMYTLSRNSIDVTLCKNKES